MKLIEVVVLVGAQCISPVQHSAGATEASKVQCAVVIEKDTSAGTLRIVPAGSSTKPEVVAVLQRLDGSAGTPPVTRIEPASATPLQPSTVKPAVPVAAAVPEAAPAPDVTAEETTPAPVAGKTPEKKPVKVQAKKPKAVEKAAEKTADKPSSQCTGGAKPKWYTNDEGRKKYRCVKAG